MTRKLNPLAEAFITGWPTQDDFQADRVFEPKHKLKEILDALERNRNVLVVGPARSGKTTLARLAGWKLRKQKDVWCVDIVDLLSPEDVKDSTRFKNDPDRLYIIENWHATLSYRETVTKAIKGCDKAQFLVTSITFSEKEQQEVAEDLGDFRISSVYPQLSAEGIIQKYMKGNIRDERRRDEFLAWLKEAPEKHKPASPNDYQAALWLESGEKRVRGNLRLLCHRLEAWDPRVRSLQEISLQDVATKLRRHLVKFHRSLPLLWKVSVICQWDMPFLCKEAYPTEADDLVEANIFVPTLDGWRMDSTDAYLFLRCQYSLAQWKQLTTEAMIEYIHDHKRLSLTVVSRLLRDVEGKGMVLRLLKNEDVLRITQQELKASCEDETLNFYWLGSLAQYLLQRLPDKQEEANKRLDIANALFAREIANAAGRSARTASLQATNWFLWFLKKGGTRFVEFVKSFIEGYGMDNLSASFLSSPSWNVRRKLLKHLSYFDSSLYKELRALSRSLSVSIQDVPFTTLLYQLMAGSVETGSLRNEKIAILVSIDEDYLLGNLSGNPRACGRLQFLMQSALWLSKSQAWRLAGIVPRIWPKLGLLTHDDEQSLIEDEAGKLGYLVVNCQVANQSAAQELVHLLLEIPLHTLIPRQRASGIGKLLCAMEKVQPGAVRQWCFTETDFLSSLFPHLGEDELDDLLFSLAVFAPDALVRIIVLGEGESRRSIYDVSVSHRAWSRCGAVNLCGERWQVQMPPNIPEAQEITECVPVQIILALYGLQLNVGLEGVHSLISRLQTLPQTSTWIPLLLARNPMPWAANQIADIVRTVLLEGVDPVENAIRNVILACMIVHSIEWERAHKFDAYHDGRRALRTAIYERMFKLELTNDQQAVRVTINDQHEIARSICELFRKVLVPVVGSRLSIEEWDDALPVVGTTDRIDFYRSKLLKARVVEWSVNARGDKLELRFFASADIGDKFLYELMGLPKSESLEEKRIRVKVISAKNVHCLDFAPFVKRMMDLEATNKFTSVKRLKRELVGQGIEDCLQTAIETGILLTYYVNNYRNPKFPTLACRLNRGHSFVRDILVKGPDKDPEESRGA